MIVKLLVISQGYDAEIAEECETLDDALAFIQSVKKHGEFQPRPKYQKSSDFEAFYGTVEKIEATTTKKGDKEMFIAHVRPDVEEGQPAKELFAVKYMPPKSTWRVGDKVRVAKSERGWPELHERETEPPF
jgi:hypothetical protein